MAGIQTAVDTANRGIDLSASAEDGPCSDATSGDEKDRQIADLTAQIADLQNKNQKLRTMHSELVAVLESLNSVIVDTLEGPSAAITD